MKFSLAFSSENFCRLIFYYFSKDIYNSNYKKQDMVAIENTLYVLLIILSFGLIVPELFQRLKIPFVTSLILIGSILGPHGINYIQSNEIINFLGFLGMTFLILMAGLETDLSKLRKLKHKIIIMAGLNGLIPFLVGFILTYSYGYSFITSLLIGIIFISSSVAVVIPSLRSAGILKENIGHLILSSVLITDIVGLVLLSIVLQNVSPITKLPLPIYFFFLAASAVAIFICVPKIANYLFHKHGLTEKHHENQLRFIIVLMMAVLAYFSVLGVQPILAAFIVGLTLSKVARSEKLYTKLYTIGYGFFVPIFFFIVGMEMDLKILFNFDPRNIILISLILGLILSKFLSGTLAGKILKFSKRDSAIFGVSSIIKLTTTLAVTYAASSLKILDSFLVTTIIIISVITTIIGPIILKFLPGWYEKT